MRSYSHALLVMIVVAGTCAVAPAAASEVRSGSARNDVGSCADVPPPPYAPAGFNPLNATAQQLQLYGFPVRPDATEDPAGFASWADAMSHALIEDDLTPSCPGPVPVFDSVYYNGNWAGHGVDRADINGNAINDVSSKWFVPRVGSNSSYVYCGQDPQEPLPPAVAVWNGLYRAADANGNNATLIQAGTISCSDDQQTYRFWNEVIPNGPRYEGPAVNPGDIVYSDVYYVNNGTCNFFEEDLTTNHYGSYSHDCVNSITHALWIEERPGLHYQPTFPDFRQWMDHYADLGTGGYSSNLDHNYIPYTMTSNCKSTGTVLADAGYVSTSDHGFDHEFEATSPVCSAPLP